MIARSDVTVVIPAYNVEWCVSDAIESVLGQTCPPREVIVVIDGATDGTADVVRRFGERVVSVEQRNAGVAAARNRGISMATSRYVAFLDADDTWLERKLADQLHALQRRPDAGMVYTAYEICDASLSRLGEVVFAPPGAAVLNTLLLEPPGIWVSSTCLFPRDVLEAVGCFDERLTTSADTDLAVRVGLRYAVTGVPRVLALYRQHGSQMHHDPDAMAHDMEIVYSKIFSLPEGEAVAGYERRARANLNSTLALAYASRGRHRQALHSAARAVSSDPLRAVALAGDALAHRLRSRTR